MCKERGFNSFKVYCYITGSFIIGLVVLAITLSAAYGEEYSRDKFRHWSDLDNNGFDTRQDTLLVQSLSLNNMHYVSLDSAGVNVKVGLWVCPYTGKVVTNPSELDIDHIVPLKYAWDHGADKWNSIQREQFANDPINVLAVLASVNRSKSDQSPEEWLPPNTSYIETYINKFWEVCKEYQLTCNEEALRDIKEEFNNVKQYRAIH